MTFSFLLCVSVCVMQPWSGGSVAALPVTVQNCCEGDILLLLDSSGSVTNYEFSVFLRFASDLLRPFSLGRGNVRVALLQVGTTPHTEFNLDVHTDQESLQEALRGVRQLQGDTNTPAALQVAKRLLTKTEEDVPKVLLWLTDGVESGDVDESMSELKAHGVSVLIVYTIHGNYQVMQRAVSPPVESHLYSVDLNSIDIITEELREAIIQIICSERLSVTDLTSHSAVLQWRPVLNAESGYYDLWYSSVGKPEIRDVLRGDSSTADLINLQPETTYTAFLQPKSNQNLLNTLSVTFTTLPDVLGPVVISLSDSGPHQIRVSWGPLQPMWVQKYTVEFGPIPFGDVHTVSLDNQRSSTLLTGLQPGTQYLVTVNALHGDGTESAMSVRACTQEALPALIDLQLFTTEQWDMEGEDVQAEWKAYEEGLKGFWVSWETLSSQNFLSDLFTSTVYLPPNTRATCLTHLASNSRVCVSPVYSTGRGDGICCTTLMLISSTTRPLLGCVWNFPSSYSGLAYATTSMVIHETLPIVLMTVTNLSSLYMLYTHGRTRSSVQDAPVLKRVPAERRAAKVILILVLLFIVSWGTSIISVNYFKYNRGTSSEFLLVIARFANIIFIALSPTVLAVGHRGLRSCIKTLLTY